MEYQKITNSLGTTSDKVPRFITKKWIDRFDQCGETRNTNKQIIFKTSMLRSDLCDHILLLKEKLLLQIQIMMYMIKN